MKTNSAPQQLHHYVTISESHYSKVHLGFSAENWVELLQNYIKNRTDLNVDFSIIHYNDPYMDMYENAPAEYKVDIECAFRDFLQVSV